MAENSLDTIVCAAVEIASAEERSAYVAQACGDDKELRGRVEQLVAAHFRAGSFMESPAALAPSPQEGEAQGGKATLVEDSVNERPNTIIGPYKLLERIGEGGMGTVWMAQQTEPVKRLVALKLIKAGMDSKQVIARFEAERQALALMDHANIARVLDGGTTGAGRPYFVMDLVSGVPITRYCDEHHLTPRQRLELFIPVCQAVQHAHQKGIIHRDLKPSNVLVATYDDKPVPKVIDFGIAKAADQKLTDKTLVTGLGNIVGTLEYMSPEQAEINQLDIDTRSDIYSLGVLLYELLAGSPPFTKKDLEMAGMLEMLRLIREQEPSKPSTKLSTADGLPTLAANRGTEPAKLTKLVRGELDWIVMKALEKDRNRRYETANGFAMDLQRYLADEPVQAGPPSTIYRLKKFMRRNRGPVLTASIFLLLLIGGIVGTTLGLFRALSAEEQAVAAERLASNNEAKARGAVNRYFTLVSEETLLDMPGFQPLREKLLEEARTYYEELLRQRSSDPELQAELAVAYFRMGEIYQATGKGKEFIAAFQTGVELAEKLVDEHPHATDLHRRLAGFWKGHRRLHLDRPAVPNRVHAVEVLERVALTWRKLADGNPDIPEFQSDLAALFSHLGELHDREPLQVLSWQEKALVIRQRLAGAYPSRPLCRLDLAASHIVLGLFFGRAGKREEAVKHLRNAIKLFDELAAEFPKAPIYREGLGIGKRFLCGYDLSRLVQPDEVEKLRRENLKLYGDLAAEFPAVPSYQHGLAESSLYVGDMLAEAGQPEEAEKAYRLAAQVYGKLLDEFPNYGDYEWGLRESYTRLVNLLTSKGRSQDAIAVSSEVMKFYEKLRTNYPNGGTVREELGKAYGMHANTLRNAGRTPEAVQAFRQAIEVLESLVAEFPDLGTLDESRWADRSKLLTLLHKTRVDSIALLKSAGRAQEAETVARQAITFWDKLAKDHPGLSESFYHLAQSYELADEWEKAVAGYSKAIDLAPKGSQAWRGRGGIQLKLKHWEEAVIDFSKAIELAPAGDGAIASAYRGRADAYRGLKQSDKALADLTKATELWPKLYAVWAWRGWFYLDQKQWDKAAADFNKVVELNPSYWLGWRDRGYVYGQLKQPDKAVADLSKAVELNPGSWLGWHDRAYAHIQLKQPDKAVADLREAVKRGMPTALDSLKNNARYASLRNRDDFKALLADVEKTK
jgi:serine/threonine protein kinase/tetratricopeptide (TPR) repeat protein